MSITAITVEPMFGRVRPEVAIVSSLGEHLVGNYVLVRIHDDSGHVGLGEASVTSVWSGETQAGTINIIREYLAPLLIGADPFDLQWIQRRLDRAVFDNSFAKSAVECALLDLQGQAANVPLYRLLGGRDLDESVRDQGIRLKFVIGKVEPNLAAERAARMVAAGWQAIKVKVGHDPRADLDRLRAVRSAIGDRTFLSVDANGGYSVEQAIGAARGFAGLGVVLFEQPTARGDHRAMAAVRRRSDIPIMADESVFTHRDALELIRQEAADILSLYPGKHGGIRNTQEIARMAETAGIACTIGSNLEREVATAAMAHLTVATPNIRCDRFPGDLIGPLYFESPFTSQSLDFRADRLHVPVSPGLGVTLGGPL
ncbi:MAG: mandelate racemase/muconate lactonizing protein [Planctomycetes bacterium]|nr:mandelate racemase/muconate lactonizing protein [Planctomycetota bacterium]